MQPLKQLHNLSLATKTTAMSVAGLLLLAIATFAISNHVVANDAERVAAERQEVNMRVAWRVLRSYGDTFRLEGDKLYVGDHLINGWNEPVDEVKHLVGGTATVFREDIRVATNVMKPRGSRAVGTPLARNAAYDAVLGKGMPYRGSADILGKPFFTAYDPIKDAQGKVIGVLYVGIPKSEVLGAISGVRWSLAIGGLLVTGLVAAACFVLARAMFRPLIQMTDAMRTLATGNVNVTIPEHRGTDEIGTMAEALHRFRTAEIAKQQVEVSNREAEVHREKAMAVLGSALERVSQGDLSVDVGSDFPQEYSRLAGHFNTALASLRALIGTVLESTAAIRSGSSEIASASDDLARRTESNAASLEQTAAAITQINQRTDATAAAANRTVERADQAIGVVGTGRSTADEAVQAMVRVSESAKGIDSVIEGLDKIAFQTRVLAMNAAVEAGRAGEAGRGFAVVADLVSALAMRAEEEAKRARDQLTVTQHEVGAARDAVERVDGALGEIVETVGEVHMLLGGIATDNQAQSSAIREISTAIGTMDQSTQQNAAMVEQTSAAARQLSEQVSRLDSHASTFRIGGNGARPQSSATAPAPHSFSPLAGTRPSPPPAVDDAEAWASF
ncbi:methyl-accepting chemotaxis protein [Sphingomonas sp. RS6]